MYHGTTEFTNDINLRKRLCSVTDFYSEIISADLCIALEFEWLCL